MTKAGNARVDNFRIDFTDAFVVNAQALDDAGAVVLNDDVSGLDEFVKSLFARLRLQVQHQRTLVAVHVEKAHAVRALHLEPHGAACLVPLRRLNLDHVGAQVGQQHAGKRPSHDLADVEHADTLQRQGHGCRCVWGGHISSLP